MDDNCLHPWCDAYRIWLLLNLGILNDLVEAMPVVGNPAPWHISKLEILKKITSAGLLTLNKYKVFRTYCVILQVQRITESTFMMCHPVPGPGQLLRHPPCGELLRHPPCGILLRHPPRGILLRNPPIIASWSMKDGLIPGPVDCLLVWLEGAVQQGAAYLNKGKYCIYIYTGSLPHGNIYYVASEDILEERVSNQLGLELSKGDWLPTSSPKWKGAGIPTCFLKMQQQLQLKNHET